ncbi:MAG: DNA recombination protein RmuC [Chlamydiia bacterium]|nr:DNA recombination protein RmuC [Chlamydiia bacterium]
MIWVLFGSLCFLLCVAGLGFAIHRRLKLSEAQMKDAFQALSFEVAEQNSRVFLNLAKNSLEKYQESAKVDLEGRQKAIDSSVQPLKEALQKLDGHQRDLEKRREGAYAALSKQLEGLVASENELRRETAHLVQALRSPQMRGSWGQVHLRRVVELAGMLNHCDFFEQKMVEDNGKVWRPDLLIRLPGQRHIVIDAKTPLHSYLDASDAGDESLRKVKLQEHASSLRKHIKDLSAKEYWKQFDAAPECVILFLPAEAFFSAALQVDPSLIETGADHNVLVATPTTLIAILRAIALTWKQEGLSKSAKEISQLGLELYERIGVFCEHWNKVGKNLNGAVEAFNQSAASFESRVLVSARKLKETGHIVRDLPEAEQIEKVARTMVVTKQYTGC